jgi:transcriptional regulator
MDSTLGFPSKSAAIIALRDRGLTEGQVAKRLGMRPRTVSSMEVRARRRLKRSFDLPENLFQDLKTQAWMRGLRPDILAERLLTTIISDRLIDAVLDEEKYHGR